MAFEDEVSNGFKAKSNQLEDKFMNMKNNDKNNKNDIQYLPMFMCFGISFGIAFGVATGNQALGMSLGMCLGVCVGTFLDAQKKKKTKLKAIFFDFDYTLGDGTEEIVISMNYALSKLGYPERTTEEIRKTIGLILEEVIEMFEGVTDPEEQKQFVDYFVEKINAIVSTQTVLYPDTKNVLRALKDRGYKIAIVSTKHDNQLEAIFEKFQIRDIIDMIVGSNNVPIPKPAPDGIQKVLQEMNLKKEEVLYVGDSIVDAKTAGNAGVQFAAVVTGTTTKEELEQHPNVYIARNLEEIYGYILSREEEK